MARCFLLWLLTAAQLGQSGTGELRLTISDPTGLPLQSIVALISEANQWDQRLETDADGVLIARRLPFGRYRVEVAHEGFAVQTKLLDIQSELPTDVHIVLTLTPVQAEVTVSPDDTLLDFNQSGTVNRIGAETLRRRITALPGRSTSDVVNTQPGWLLEANGILHPRGSEYQVQFVVDGLPMTDNRSPGFAPEIEADDVHAMTILTAGYPAEYGRKLGGVIEVVTAGDARRGLHGSFVASGGSFGTASGYATTQYGWGRNILAVSADVTHTDRYLDPPVQENDTNSGTGSNVAVHFEREFSDTDRLGLVLRHGQTRFQVPNEHVQEEAGQLQERTNTETTGQFSYQHIFSSNVLADVRSMARSLGAGLSSNPMATPILAQQDRGFREGYVKATLSAHVGMHEWKAGIDADFGMIRETFGYQITDPSQFDPRTAPGFAFADRRLDREEALFVQDHVRVGSWTINAGLRWDHYRLVVEQSAFSPRLGVAWAWPAADLVLRASYDRAFQTPAIENLLLASSPALDSLNDSVVRLPVQPSLGNFYEVGLSKRLLSKLRVDVTHFNRTMTNFADDNVLLNTGVSFPIAFHDAHINGTEVKLDLRSWRALSGSVSYAHMTGVGSLPITGGLLLGDDPTTSLRSTNQFPISQDQRHTVRGRVSYELSARAWVALGVSYGSGLPAEFVGDRQQAVAQYGEGIVDRVDIENGRVRPSASFDISGGFVVLRSKKQTIRVQTDVVNLTNRLNVINFAGLFSGTAVAPPRSIAVRVQSEF